MRVTVPGSALDESIGSPPRGIDPWVSHGSGNQGRGGRGMARRLTGTMLDGPVQAPPLGSLTSVDVYISSQCNRRCTYCFLPAEFFSSGARMGREEFAGVVNWCQQQGIGEMTLLGGEPSLHRYFPEKVKRAHGQGLQVRVVTNGHRQFRRLLTDGSIEPRHLSRVAVSLDSL